MGVEKRVESSQVGCSWAIRVKEEGPTPPEIGVRPVEWTGFNVEVCGSVRAGRMFDIFFRPQSRHASAVGKKKTLEESVPSQDVSASRIQLLAVGFGKQSLANSRKIHVATEPLSLRERTRRRFPSPRPMTSRRGVRSAGSQGQSTRNSPSDHPLRVVTPCRPPFLYRRGFASC